MADGPFSPADRFSSRTTDQRPPAVDEFGPGRWFAFGSAPSRACARGHRCQVRG